MHHFSRILAPLAVLGAIVPANGQPAQTPENAHRFLATVLPGVAYFSAGRDSPTDAFRSYPKRSFKVYERASDNICWAYGPNNEELSSYWFDFPTMISITVEGDVLRIQRRASDPFFESRTLIEAGSSELAARIAFALQVIKDSCDPTAGMGF